MGHDECPEAYCDSFTKNITRLSSHAICHSGKLLSRNVLDAVVTQCAVPLPVKGDRCDSQKTCPIEEQGTSGSYSETSGGKKV